MPLSFLSIKAIQKAQAVDISWKVAFEQGVSKYEVERSANGIDFSVIGTVNSKGNSNTPVEYGFPDTKPLEGVAYYRVKSIENGGGKYSPIVKVNTINEKAAVSIYPNPVKDKLRISLQNHPSFEKGTITVRNSQGKTIMQVVNASVNGYILDVDRLAPGMYILALTSNNGETLIEKFVKY
jgi:asparagine N-glycosylation enzyme membrane subunit Stt3